MNPNQFRNLKEELVSKRKEILEARNRKYSDQADYLGNFSRVSRAASILNIKPSRESTHYALFEALVKLDRIINLSNKGENPSEILDSVLDLGNYADLAYACYKEDYGVSTTEEKPSEETKEEKKDEPKQGTEKPTKESKGRPFWNR